MVRSCILWNQSITSHVQTLPSHFNSCMCYFTYWNNVLTRVGLKLNKPYSGRALQIEIWFGPDRGSNWAWPSRDLSRTWPRKILRPLTFISCRTGNSLFWSLPPKRYDILNFRLICKITVSKRFSADIN